MSLSRGRLQISDLNADLLGGKHQGEWQADFSIKPAVCKGSGSFSEVSLAGLAAAMKDDWVSGTAKRKLRSEGAVPRGVLAIGRWVVAGRDAQTAVLPQVSLGEDSEPLRVHAA